MLYKQIINMESSYNCTIMRLFVIFLFVILGHNITTCLCQCILSFTDIVLWKDQMRVCAGIYNYNEIVGDISLELVETGGKDNRDHGHFAGLHHRICEMNTFDHTNKRSPVNLCGPVITNTSLAGKDFYVRMASYENTLAQGSGIDKFCYIIFNTLPVNIIMTLDNTTSPQNYYCDRSTVDILTLTDIQLFTIHNGASLCVQFSYNSSFLLMGHQGSKEHEPPLLNIELEYNNFFVQLVPLDNIYCAGKSHIRDKGNIMIMCGGLPRRGRFLTDVSSIALRGQIRYTVKHAVSSDTYTTGNFHQYVSKQAFLGHYATYYIVASHCPNWYYNENNILERYSNSYVVDFNKKTYTYTHNQPHNISSVTRSLIALIILLLFSLFI